MAISKVQLPLKNVAKQIRNVASALAPRKTGNLRNVLRSYNTPDRMVKFDDKGGANITFYFAPPGATYGKYWNKPYGTGRGTTATIKRRYPQHFDYAEKAYKDTSVKKLIKDYTKALAQQIALDLREAVRSK
jgi:hypothetical protein